MNVVAVVAAAGIGQRFGAARNKALFSLLGRPLIAWSLLVLQESALISEIIPVVKESDVETTAALLGSLGISKARRVVTGGRQRQDSVYQGLKRISPSADAVLIHDGARPLLDVELVERAVTALPGFDGVVCGVPVKDTIKEIGEDACRRDAAPPEETPVESVITVRKTLARDCIWAVQTPQVFPFRPLLRAYERAMSEDIYTTDDAALIERFGGSVRVVAGSYRNIKITTPEDILIAEALLK